MTRLSLKPAANPSGDKATPRTIRMTDDEVRAVLSWQNKERRSFSDVIRWLVAKERGK